MSSLKNKINEFREKLTVVLEKVGLLTKVQRLLICMVTFAVIGGAYYYFILMPRQDEYTKVQKIYKTQVDMLATYKKRAEEISIYEKKMAETQASFNEAMKALPDKKEIPSLLTGVSMAGSNAGLSFLLFQPEKEINKEFYSEIPVSIKVAGRYHQIADFFFQVLQLNRIVNINDVDVKSKQGGESLEMSCKAVTYMFLEKQALPAEKGQKPKQQIKKT
ncbi:MAG: protein PilO [Bdellovibrionales bacterium RIFOXYB2_FULL_36_6]|nr:MAG: protein PilO [Bdellovibrionales bacterium RIFOXYB2_FULL_36_6]